MPAVRIELPSGTPAELARPANKPTMGVVVAPDIWGLRPLFDDLCARLAAEHGWAVCAVEPFPGQSFPEGDVDARFAAVPSLTDERMLGDLEAAADVLACDQVSVIGFCMGGMYSLKSSGRRRFPRCAAFYGMITLPVAWRGPGQGEPLDWLRRPGASPVLAIVGGQDPYTPAEDVAALAALAHAEVVGYPDAEHGFVHDASRPTHRPADAADAWARVVAFLGARDDRQPDW